MADRFGPGARCARGSATTNVRGATEVSGKVSGLKNRN